MLLALFLSGLLHALLLVMLQPSLESETYQLPAQPAYPDSIQARFPRFHYIPIELIETPDVVKEKAIKQPTPFMSDKNAEAADRYTKKDLPDGLPYSEGNTGLHVFQGGDGMPPGRSFAGAASSAGGGQRSGKHDPQLADAGSGLAGKPYEGDGLIPWEQLRKQSEGALSQEPVPASQTYQPFSRDLLHGGGRAGNRAYSNDGQFDNRKSTAPDFGDVTLSTYAWEWAPYIEYMRRRLRAHIYPPPAFYVMGAISGEVRLHFKLLRNGTVEGLEMLGYQGHVSFVQTSINAVRASNPFKPLPADFPDEALEMTWIFSYYLR
ncbi:TonB C-terminal domain-containing protein [bacterium]|nr:TonB C-terminal domain-containing protein [bacterium]